MVLILWEPLTNLLKAVFHKDPNEVEMEALLHRTFEGDVGWSMGANARMEAATELANRFWNNERAVNRISYLSAKDYWETKQHYSKLLKQIRLKREEAAQEKV
jgi:hypothetical protein